MATLREMLDWMQEFDFLCSDDSEPYHLSHWKELDPESGDQFDHEVYKRSCRIRRIAARMTFGREAFYGPRIWGGYWRAEWLLETFVKLESPDPRDAGDVIDWLAQEWDANPATLFADLRQAFPTLDDPKLGEILSSLDHDLRYHADTYGIDGWPEGRQRRIVGIDSRAVALNVACQIYDENGQPKDMPDGHLLAAMDGLFARRLADFVAKNQLDGTAL